METEAQIKVVFSGSFGDKEALRQRLDDHGLLAGYEISNSTSDLTLVTILPGTCIARKLFEDLPTTLRVNRITRTGT